MLDHISKDAHQDKSAIDACKILLGQATERLTMLDPGLGDEELIKSVAAAQAELDVMAGKA